MQHIMLIGAMTKELERRTLANKMELATFSFVVNVFKQNTEHKVWYRINVWEPKMMMRLEKLRPGARLALVGKLDIPTAYKDNSGEAKPSLQVNLESMELLLAPKSDDVEPGSGRPPIRKDRNGVPEAPQNFGGGSGFMEF